MPTLGRNTSPENNNIHLRLSSTVNKIVSLNKLLKSDNSEHIKRSNVMLSENMNDRVSTEDHILSNLNKNDRQITLDNKILPRNNLDNKLFDTFLQEKDTPSSTFNKKDNLENKSESLSLQSETFNSSFANSIVKNGFEQPLESSLPESFSLFESMSSINNSFKASSDLLELVHRKNALENKRNKETSDQDDFGNSGNEQRYKVRSKERSQVHEFVSLPVQNNRVSSDEVATFITKRLFFSNSMETTISDCVTSESTPRATFTHVNNGLKKVSKHTSNSNGQYNTNNNNTIKIQPSVLSNLEKPVTVGNNQHTPSKSSFRPLRERVTDGKGIVSSTFTTTSQMSSFIRNEFLNNTMATPIAEPKVKRRRMTTNDGHETSQSSSSSSSSLFVSQKTESDSGAFSIGASSQTNKRLQPLQRSTLNDQTGNGLLNKLSNNTFARVSFLPRENSFLLTQNNERRKNETSAMTSFPISVNSVFPTSESTSRNQSIDVDTRRILFRGVSTQPFYSSHVHTDKSQYSGRTVDDINEMKKSSARSPAFDHVSIPIAAANSSSIYFRDGYDGKTFNNDGISTFVSDTFTGVGKNNNRFSRQSNNEDTDKCRMFIEGDPANRMFFSPGFPGNYTKQTNCIRVLEAPKGNLLRLDFRDVFELEPSVDCKYDFLEVRDGMHGFSKPVGNFCSTNFPPMITSSERHLWLRFHSDENIEYQGFKAIYEFVPRPAKAPPELDTCEIELSAYEGVLNLTKDVSEERFNLSKMHNISLDCMWKITVQKGWKIQLGFIDFKLNKPNDCDANFLDVFSDRTDLNDREKNFCGSIADSVISKNNIMFVRYFSEPTALKDISIVAVFTAFHEKVANCEPNEYDCEDNTCIDINLRCNGRNNCRYRWDEHLCVDTSEKKFKEEHIIIMVIFSLIVTSMCATCIFKCITKIMRDHRTIQEHLRQSRAERLDQISNKKKSSSRDDVKKSVLSLIPPTGGGGVHMLPSKQGHKGSGIATVTSNAIRRSRSNSTQSSSSQRFIAANALNPRPIDSCYVPGGDLVPILLKSTDNSIGTNTNNDVDLYNNHVTKSDDIMLNDEVGNESVGDNDEMNDLNGSGGLIVPEMCDSACQTRESLFDPKIFSHQTSMSDRSLSPISSQGHDNSSSLHGYPCHDQFRPKVHHCKSTIKSQHDPHKYGWVSDNPSSHESSGSHHTYHEGSQHTSHKSNHPHYKSLERQGSSLGTGGPEGYKSSTEGSITSHPMSPPAKFSTFGYRNDHQKNPKYRAEVAIEVDQSRGIGWRRDDIAQSAQGANLDKNLALNKPQQRPYSVETTKSAPDVIVTH